jgi:hypothetical protein
MKHDEHAYETDFVNVSSCGSARVNFVFGNHFLELLATLVGKLFLSSESSGEGVSMHATQLGFYLLDARLVRTLAFLRALTLTLVLFFGLTQSVLVLLYAGFPFGVRRGRFVVHCR